MPVAWDSDNPTDAQQLARNVKAVLRQIVAEAADRRSPSIAMAQQWHRDLYRNIALPVDYYAGEVRDSDPNFPELFGYEVGVGEHLGVLSANVPAALATFETAVAGAVTVVDNHLADREATAEGTGLYVTLVAVTHGEWIRIHPFANGNGRTSRIWTHWLAARYDLPPLMRIKPRPDDRMYAIAAKASMTGNHTPMRAWLLDKFFEP
jgi:fido (protein-threonine AMPylation protein)